MKQEGHIGVSLLLASPVTGLLLYFEEMLLSAVFTLTVVWLASIPDIDTTLSEYLPIKHRGFTHTVHFGLLVGSASVVIGVLVERSFEVQLVVDELYITVLFLAGFLGILFHSIGDVMTQHGVTLIPDYIVSSGVPLVGRKFAFQWFNYNNLVGNIGFLFIGAVSMIVSVMIGLNGLTTELALLYAGAVSSVVPVVLVAKSVNWKMRRRSTVIAKATRIIWLIKKLT